MAYHRTQRRSDMFLLRLRHVVRGGEAGHIGAKVLTGVARCCGSRQRHLSTVAAVLESRAVIEISGADSKALLQGLMTNDMSLLDKGKDKLPCISAAFLNPKGRVVGDALVLRSPRHDAKNKTGYLLDCPVSVAESLKSHLKTYKVRSKAKIKDATSAYDVLVSGVYDPWEGSSKTGEGVVANADNLTSRFTDPRSDNLGVRLLRPKNGTGSSDTSWAGGDELVSEDRYHALRMLNGVAEGAELVDSIPLESNLDLLGSISFTKGCYVGQELTARTHFKGFVRKRILPVLFPRLEFPFLLSPIQSAASIFSDAREGEGLERSMWGPGVTPPAPGSHVIDGVTGDKKGSLVALSPVYNVGLARLRLGKIMPPMENFDPFAMTVTPGKHMEDVGPVPDCRILGCEFDGETPRSCLPVTPPWWPVDLDPTTGKISA